MQVSRGLQLTGTTREIASISSRPGPHPPAGWTANFRLVYDLHASSPIHWHRPGG